MDLSSTEPLTVAFIGGSVTDGETGCYSIRHGMNYTGEWISLPKGKKRIRVPMRLRGRSIFAVMA